MRKGLPKSTPAGDMTHSLHGAATWPLGASAFYDFIESMLSRVDMHGAAHMRRLALR